MTRSNDLERAEKAVHSLLDALSDHPHGPVTRGELTSLVRAVRTLVYEEDRARALVLGEGVQQTLEGMAGVGHWSNDDAARFRGALTAHRAQALREAADSFDQPVWLDLVNNALLRYGFYNPANSMSEAVKIRDAFVAELRRQADAAESGNRS